MKLFAKLKNWAALYSFARWKYPMSILWADLLYVSAATFAWYALAVLIVWLPTASDTVFAGFLAAVAAIGSSAMTGYLFQYTENKKHTRETEALKGGVMVEMMWLVDRILAGVKRKDTGFGDVLRWEIPVGTFNQGYPVFDRAAEKLAITGIEFSSATYHFFSTLRSSAANTTTDTIYLGPASMIHINRLMQAALNSVDKNSGEFAAASKSVKKSAAIIVKQLSDVTNLSLADKQAETVNEFLAVDAVAHNLFNETVPQFQLCQKVESPNCYEATPVIG